LRRRLTVLKLSDEGLPMSRITRLLGCSVGTVSNDLDRFEEGGLAGLEPKPVGGSEPKVTEAQLFALGQVLSPKCAKTNLRHPGSQGPRFLGTLADAERP